MGEVREVEPEPERNDLGELIEQMQGLGRTSDTARDALFQRVYDELRAIAGRLMKGERTDHTLQPTALVNEAFIRLVEQNASWESRAHFFGIAARAMRQILVDHARKTNTRKRGGELTRITLTDQVADEVPMTWRVIDLDQALTKLEQQDPRMARVAELRAFAGMTNRETAHVLGVSRRTVVGDWSVAKLWLTRELEGAAT